MANGLGEATASRGRFSFPCFEAAQNALRNVFSRGLAEERGGAEKCSPGRASCLRAPLLYIRDSKSKNFASAFSRSRRRGLARFSAPPRPSASPREIGVNWPTRDPAHTAAASVPQELTGIHTRILPQVVLMIGLGAVPGAGGLDRGGDRASPLARCIDARDHAARRLFLFG